jgi:hypothetical protein
MITERPMKKRVIFCVASFIVLFSLSISTDVLACTKDNLSVSIGIDFFNRFQSNETGIFTDAFQRYHTLTVKYDQNPWSIQGIYNWLDKVSSQNSVHALTLWGIDLDYRISENRILILNYRWVYDVLTKDIDSREIQLNMVQSFPVSNSWTSECRYGFRWDGQQLKYNLGAKLTFRTILNLSINDLSPEDSLVLEKDSLGRLPVSLGVILKLNNYNRLEITYCSNLFPAANEMNQWLKTSLHFQL